MCNRRSVLVKGGVGGWPSALVLSENGTSALPTATSLLPFGEIAASTMRYGPVRHVCVTLPAKSYSTSVSGEVRLPCQTNPKVQSCVHAGRDERLAIGKPCDCRDGVLVLV